MASCCFQVGGVLVLLSPWLELRDLSSLLAVNRHCRTHLPRQTWELTVASVRHDSMLLHVARRFPNIRRLRLRNVLLPLDALTHALSKLLAANWQLRELELQQVWCLHDGHLRILTQEWTTLERLEIQQCDQVKTPAIHGPNLRTLVVHSKSMTQFHQDSTFPVLKELVINSRTLSTIDARTLVKRTLLGAAFLETLVLSDCSAVEQVLIDPGELPRLKTLSLKGCLSLERLHVSSRTLQALELSLCDHLTFLLLDVPAIEGLDASCLSKLTHLYLRSEYMRVFTLRGDSNLARETTQIICPNLQAADLEGTSLTREDLIVVEDQTTT